MNDEAMNRADRKPDEPQSAGDVRVIAFYLPQFHPIPENDLWWGEGFTEWTNVRKAVANFAGHYQPHEPGELGYYDLRDPDVRERQAALAREHGIDGFCYYYYWFNGKRLLERPLDEVVASGRPDFPFCVCWANENWTRRWDGREQDVLIAQEYSAEDARALIHTLIPLMRDRRYIRVDGRPLVMIYKAALIPDSAAMLALWRDECRHAGIGEIYTVSAITTWHGNPEQLGFDAAVEFPPHGHHAGRVNDRISFTNPRFSGSVFDFRTYVAELMTVPRPDFKLFRGLLPAWDNTARRQDAGSTFIGSSPEVFQYWLEHALEQTRLRHRGDERLLFINAWNEWGEGCHLEPDRRHGRAYLEAVRDGKAAARVLPPLRPPWAEVVACAAAADAAPDARIVRSPVAANFGRAAPRVSVVMPAYNHERFVRATLDSVVAQSLAELEIIAVDDGSQDATGALLDEFAAGCTTHAVTIVHQPNAGAHAAINRGLARARGEFVAIVNSDDRYAPTRLATMLDALRDRRADFAFSSTLFVDDDGVELAGDNSYVERLRDGLARFAASGNPLPALLRINVAISTGNFVIRRSLLEKTGGMCAFRICHDWDFILAASYHTPLVFVREPLYEYRIHHANTYSGQRLLAHLEADQVIDRFFEDIEAHPVMREPGSRSRFLAEVRRRGLTHFLPAELRKRLQTAQD
jgi:glycosyltransferase involved in cell wall biosynthesis